MKHSAYNARDYQSVRQEVQCRPEDSINTIIISHSGELKEAMCTEKMELWELDGYWTVRACLECPFFSEVFEVFSTLNLVK